MHDAVKTFFLVLSALFPIVDPLSGSPIYLAMTRGISPAARRMISWRVTLNSFVLMVGSYLVGSHVLNFFGVSLPVVQVGGGLVVVALGWSLLMEKDGDHNQTSDGVQTPQSLSRQVFYPLTLPLTVGPGSISVAVTLGANGAHAYGAHLVVIVAALVAMGVIAVSIYFCYGFADQLARVLGETGTAVIIRLSSFLLVCIGVQIMWDGISALVASIPLHVR